MARTMIERAGALMWAMEGSARAGMGMHSTASYLQFMMEETAKQAGVVYMAVITRDGEIVAHSDRGRVGGNLYPREGMEGIEAFPHISWRVVQTKDGARLFEAFRIFNPLPGFANHSQGHGRMMGRMRGMRHGAPEWSSRATPSDPFTQGKSAPPPAGIAPPPASGESGASRQGMSRNSPGELLIVIALDMTSFDNALVAGQRGTLFTALLVGLLGLGGFTALYWAQSYKLSRRLLLDTRAYAEEVIGSLPLGLIIFDTRGKVTQVNATAETLFGRSSDTLLGSDIHGFQNGAWAALAERVDQGEAVLEEEHSLESWGEPVGRTIPVSISASRILNEEGERLGRLFLLRDLREVKRLRAELRRSERLSTLGNMAARVAHEIRNPLSSIKGFATFLGSCCTDGQSAKNEAMRDAARTMIGEVDRLNRVVSELLDFARPANLAIAPTDLGELLGRVGRLVSMDAEAKGVTLTVKEPPEPVSVAVDAERMTQALLNLLLNAVQATGAEGVVTLGVSELDEDGVSVIIKDNGRGMSAEVLAQVFNPYFTTKATGTGLGLSIVSRIVEDHHGEIRMESDPGKGTTVIVLLPRSEAVADAAGIPGSGEKGGALAPDGGLPEGDGHA